MKTAIATRADNNIKEMTDITHPIMRKYAEKIGADFIVLGDKGEEHYHYRILQLYDLFDKYDRIISMDSDILIQDNCPNLFDVVPEDMIGSVLEDKGSRTEERRQRIKKIQMMFGSIGWKTGYINTGVAVFSKEHRDIFRKRELWFDFGYDDVYLGYHLNKANIQIFELDWKFNCMRCFLESWNGNPNKFDAYILHYAGGGSDKSQQLIEIKRDYRST